MSTILLLLLVLLVLLLIGLVVESQPSYQKENERSSKYIYATNKRIPYFLKIKNTKTKHKRNSSSSSSSSRRRRRNTSNFDINDFIIQEDCDPYSYNNRWKWDPTNCNTIE